MKTLLLLVLAILFILPGTCARAQVLYYDDFEDGNFRDPNWEGDTSQYAIEGGRLVQVGSSGNISLSIDDTNEADTLILEFLIDYSFPQADDDGCQVLLTNDFGSSMIVDLNFLRERPLNLWFVRSDLNAFIEGEASPVMGPDSTLRVRFSRFKEPLVTQQEWRYRLEADYSGGRNFALQGELFLFDQYRAWTATISPHTFSETGNYEFDDFSVYGANTTDTLGPMISQVVLGDDFTEFLLYFDETLITRGGFADPFDQIYFANRSEEIRTNGPDLYQNYLWCYTDDPLPFRDTLELVMINVVDDEGDTTARQSVKIFFDPAIAPQAGQLVINEIMVDPSPSVGLPEAEFVELYNNTEYRINLGLVQIQSGANPIPLPADTLAPGGYVVLTRPEHVEEFQALGIDVLGLPLARLANNGDGVLLRSQEEIIASVFYDRSFYNDPDRQGDGYSLEYVGAGADAGCSDGWRASLDPMGGTPGRRNSADGLADVSGPSVIGLQLSEDTVFLRFSEDLAPDQFGADLFTLDNGALINEIIVTGDSSLQLVTDITPGVLYTLTVFADYQDCSGNFPTSDQRLRLGIPQQVAPGDVRINEVLFDPASGGSDYLELINCSQKLLQIGGWRLVNRQNGSEQVIETDRFFLPGEYLTITENPQQLLDYYPQVYDTVLVHQPLPVLPEASGSISLVNNGVVISELEYSTEQHYPLLADYKGVSLELQEECDDVSNTWFSAAPEVLHGTPTRANSRWEPTIFPPDEFYLRLTRATFSPDGDGFEDNLALEYGTDEQGYLLFLQVFDAQGRSVRAFPREELPIGEGSVDWDGLDDDGQQVSRGVYILSGVVTSPAGDVQNYRFPVALAR